MKDNSALILQDRRSALVAGLDWQFVSGSDLRSQIREIRRQAAEMNARTCVRIGREHHAYVGYSLWDATLSEEKRPARLYSFAALLAHRLHPSHATVAWRIGEGHRQGWFAVVVIENHLPVADQILPLAQARATIQRYRRTPEHNHADNFWSNDLTEFPDAQPMILDWPDIKPGKQERIRSIPVDPVGVAAAVMGLALLVSGLLVATEYSTYLGHRDALQAGDTTEQAARYERALQGVRPQLGADSASINRLLDDWMEQPAVLATWVLSNVDCDTQRCVQHWQSEGGYTSDLLKTLDTSEGAQAQPDMTNNRHMQVSTPQKLVLSGVSAFDELPDAASLKQLLFDEQQIWQGAGVSHVLDINGSTWPAGSEPVAGQAALRRHSVTITAPVNLIRNVLQDYAGLAWWNRMRIHVKPFDANNLVMVELQGAFYAF